MYNILMKVCSFYKKWIFFIFLTVASIILFSCDFNTLLDPDVDKPVNGYFEYWSQTCQFAKVEYGSENTVINGIVNLAARDRVQIDVVCINPKEHKLLSRDGDCFCLKKGSETVTCTDWTEENITPDLIRITAELSDDYEGEEIFLEGCLWPDNRVELGEDQLRESNPELFVSAKFIQNTPPDNVSNLYVPSGLINGRHYVSFELPDLTLKRNSGSTYELSYYLREEDGSLTYKGTKMLTLEDNKNFPDSKFIYYFDEQEENLLYEYCVQVYGPHGLKAPVISTAPGLGLHTLLEPEIEFSKEYNQKKDDNGYEYIEVAEESDEVTYCISAEEPGVELTGTVDGAAFSGNSEGSLACGAHILTATVHMDSCRDITVIKKIMIVRSLREAEFEFEPGFNGNTDSEGYEYIEVADEQTPVAFSVTSPDSGTTVTGTLDGEEIQQDMTGNLSTGYHTLVVTVQKDYYTDSVITKKIRVVKTMSGALIELASNGKANGLTAENSGEQYEVFEYTGSGLDVIVTKPEEASSVKIVVNGTETSTVKTLADGFNEITATVYKDNYIPVEVSRKVYVVAKLTEPSVEYSSDGVFNGQTAVSGETEFDVVEYTDSFKMEITNTYSFSGSTLTVSVNENKTTGSSQEIVLASEYSEGFKTVTATVTKDYCLPVSVTKRFYVVPKLTEPSVEYSSDGTFNGQTAVSGETEFDVVEYTDSFKMEITNTYSFSGSTLTVSVNENKTTGSSQEIVLASEYSEGFKTVTATVTKDYCLPVSVTKRLYVVPKLTEPEIEFTNKTSESGSKILFSYLSYDNLLMNVNDTYQGENSTMTIILDGSTYTGNMTGKELAVGEHSLEVTVEKSLCESVSVSKNFTVGIKPVILSVGAISAYNTDGDDHVDLKRYFYAATTDTSQVTLKAYTASKGTTVSKNHTIYPDAHTLYLNSPDSVFYFYSSKIEDYDKSSDNDDLGTVNYGQSDATRNLKALKSNKYFSVNSTNSSRGRYSFNVSLSEVPSATFEFTPALSGISDSYGYEYVEVENASDTVSYSVLCYEENVSLSGSVDGTSYSGSVSASFGLGEHTIKAVTSQSGSGSLSVTKKIKVVQSLKEPEFAFYTDSGLTTVAAATSVEESGYSDYTAYDINLAADGSGCLYYSAGTDDTDVSITVVDELTGEELDGSIAPGPHVIEVTVSKAGYLSREFELGKVYVQGVLSDPVITYTGTQNGSDSSGNPIYKFSYKTYDSMPFNVTAGNEGNTVEVKIGDTVTASSGWYLDPDTVKTISVTQTRQYCRKSEYSETVSVKIKPITLYMQATASGELAAWITGFGASGGFDVRGAILINGNTVFSYESGKYGISQNCWCTLKDTDYSYTGVFNSPSDEITISFSSFRRNIGSGSDKQFGDRSSSNTLKNCKTGKNNGSEGDAGTAWTFIVDTIAGDSSGYVRPRVKFTASE